MKITTPHGTLEGESIEAILAKYGFDCLRGANLRGFDLPRADLTRANLTGAVLTGAILTGAVLTGAVLTGADLSGAILSGAILTGADLSGAILTGADLSGANLTGAILTGADLTRANLTRANLTGAILTGADLTRANLTRANLTGAILSGAILSGAKLPELTAAQTSILPNEGDIIGWKKALTDDDTPVIVKLLIPADAQRSNSTGRKCRASKARILDLQNMQGDSLPPDTTAHSRYDSSFHYRKGETVNVENFDTNRWNECTPGIHFFITRIEAVEY